MAVEGVLTSTNNPVLVAMSEKKGPKQVLLLTANKVTLVDAKNKQDFPAQGNAIIFGIVTKRKSKVGSETVEWAIQNGKGHIPFTLPKGGKHPKAGTKLRASGKVRVVDEKFLLEAIKVDPVKE